MLYRSVFRSLFTPFISTHTLLRVRQNKIANKLISAWHVDDWKFRAETFQTSYTCHRANDHNLSKTIILALNSEQRIEHTSAWYVQCVNIGHRPIRNRLKFLWKMIIVCTRFFRVYRRRRVNVNVGIILRMCVDADEQFSFGSDNVCKKRNGKINHIYHRVSMTTDRIAF